MTVYDKRLNNELGLFNALLAVAESLNTAHQLAKKTGRSSLIGGVARLERELRSTIRQTKIAQNHTKRKINKQFGLLTNKVNT